MRDWVIYAVFINKHEAKGVAIKHLNRIVEILVTGRKASLHVQYSHSAPSEG